MDKNRTEGLKKEVKGGAKEVAGKVTGNTTKEVAGKAEKKSRQGAKRVWQGCRQGA